jgi:uncharacterized membrane protein YfcA
MAFPSLGVALLLLGIGVAIGVVGGMAGIGGGVLVIPLLMIFFGFSQARANGTSLAMLLPPIGIFAVLSYWRAGNVDLGYALLLAIGFSVGAYFGAMLVNTGRIHPTALRILFALLLLYIAGRILFRPGGRARVGLEIAMLMTAYYALYFAMRLFGRRLKKMPNWPRLYRQRQHHPFEHDYEI